MHPTASAAALPVEIWREILAHTVLDPLLPRPNASLFDDIDLFGHPCKVYCSQLRIRTTIRLVCRLWNEIIESDKRYGALFTGTVSLDETLVDEIRLACRLEIVNRWSQYCRSWPCVLTRRHLGRCPFGAYISPGYEENTNGVINCSSKTPLGVEVLRLIDDNRDPSQLLSRCTRLRALAMRFNGFSSVTSGTSFTQERLKHLSHLQLDGLCDNGGISVLNLPQLTYLKLTMELGWDGVGIFPLEIQMPKVTTICIDGWVNSRYAVSVSEFLLSTVSSLVNLLLPYNGENGHNIFSVLNLEKFEKLSAFGVGIRNLTRILSTSLDTPPLLFHPSLSLVMFGLDAHNRKDCFKFRKEYVRTLIRRLTGSASLFSKLVIPLEWAELQDLWVQACEKFDLGDGFSKEDPLPCYWSVLNQVDKSNIPIEDRNGVGIREGAGAIFAERMREYSENLEYTERRWSWIELWCKNWNHWDYRTEWEEEDWP